MSLEDRKAAARKAAFARRKAAHAAQEQVLDGRPRARAGAGEPREHAANYVAGDHGGGEGEHGGSAGTESEH